MSWGGYEITSSEGGVRLINGLAQYLMGSEMFAARFAQLGKLA